MVAIAADPVRWLLRLIFMHVCMCMFRFQKGVSSFVTDDNATRDKGHYRTENCTKQEAPPEDNRPTISHSLAARLPGALASVQYGY